MPDLLKMCADWFGVVRRVDRMSVTIHASP